MRHNEDEVKTVEPRCIRSILVVELTRLGDVIAALHPVRLLSQHYAGARLHLMVDRAYAGLCQTMLPSSTVHGIPDVHAAWGFLKAVHVARQVGSDLACSMSPGRRNVFVVRASGAPRKTGYLTPTGSLTPFLRRNPVGAVGFRLASDQTFEQENIEERGLKICRALGLDASFRPAPFSLPPETVRDVRLRLLRRDGFPTRPYLLVHPFARWKFRMWGLERYSRLIGRLLEVPGFDILLLCAPGEIGAVREVTSRYGKEGRVKIFASSDLIETAVTIQGARLFIGNDSGPLHLAATLGVRFVGLFGPASPALTGPHRSNGVMLFHPVECSPCDQRTCVRPNNSCMTLIGEDEVYEAVAQHLRFSAGGPVVAHA